MGKWKEEINIDKSKKMNYFAFLNLDELKQL